MRWNRPLKRIGAALLSCTLLLSGCGAPAPQPEEKVTITVWVDTPINGMDLYWSKLAAKFPDIKLDVTYQENMAPEEEIARRIAHGDVADLVFSQYLDTGMPGLPECFLDLSGKPYTSRYQTSYLNGLDVDGQLYCLPADLAVQGFIYNKTVFDELGLAVPSDYQEFETLCGRLREAGYRPGALATGNRAPAELFVRACAAASPHSLTAWKWAEDFNEQAGSARGEPLDLALDLLKAYEGLGMISPDDFTTSRWQHRHLLAEREAAMVLGNASSLWRFSSADDFRLMPFFSPIDGNGYFFICPLVSMAVGKQVAEDPAKEDAVDRILDYITSEEGQLDLMAMDKGIISPILGMREIDGMDFYHDVKSKLTDEALLRFPKFPRCVDALNTGLGDFLWGGLDADGLTEKLDAANQDSGKTAAPAIAVAEADFTLAETNGLALEAMKEALGTEIALLRQKPKGQRYDNWFICGKLYEGPVTETDLLCIHPLEENPKTSQPMIRVEMTGAQLLEMLSYEGAYYYSGVTVRWRQDKGLGTPVAQALLDSEGRKINPEERLVVAILSQSMLGEDRYLSQEETGVTLWAALVDYMEARKTLIPFAPNPAVYE